MRTLSNFKCNQPGGFTLIEIIAVLVLLGILLASSVTPFASIISGFILARNASDSAQKSLLAMSRIEKELNLQSGIDSSSTTTNLKFFPSVDSTGRTASATAYSIRYDPSLKTLIFSNGTDYTLLDNVDSYVVAYGNMMFKNLSAKITITFTCTGFSSPFTTTIALR